MVLLDGKSAKKSYTQGFTLIELLVVIAIIALLSSVVLAAFSGASSRGRDAKRIADLQSVAAALELYYQDNNSYPAAASGSPGGQATCISSPWWGCWGSTNGAPGSTELRLLPSQYIQFMPQDPSFLDDGNNCTYNPGNPDRSYMYWSDGQSFILATTLENPVPRTDPHYYDDPTQQYGCTASGNWAIKGGGF